MRKRGESGRERNNNNASCFLICCIVHLYPFFSFPICCSFLFYFLPTLSLFSNFFPIHTLLYSFLISVFLLYFLLLSYLYYISYLSSLLFYSLLLSSIFLLLSSSSLLFVFCSLFLSPSLFLVLSSLLTSSLLTSSPLSPSLLSWPPNGFNHQWLDRILSQGYIW